MTTFAQPDSAPAHTPSSLHPEPRLGLTPVRILHSEWTKLRSLASSRWTLLATAVLMVGTGAIFAWVSTTSVDTSDPSAVARFDAVATSLNGVVLAQLAVGVLGVLMIGGEYSTGMIRSSLTVVPRRLPVLGAKLGIFAGVVLAVGVASSAVAYAVGQAILATAGLGVSWSEPGALRSVLGVGLYLTVAGVVAVALGALLRNTASAISTFVAVFFVIPPLAALLPTSITSTFVQYLPSNAGAALYGGGRGVSDPLSPWTGFAVLCAYAVVLVAVAAWELRRRDV